ncbi:MFS transporter [Rhodococcus sp. ACS1]|uniref:MFS transporter n=1 Tax=Rhodococcus sp. ACS1 TaxID=2028570 RepID=UPI000BB0F86D|nr:MFS transporter [Rhodococcus sp. ACS1]PBC35600.1 MFS transporter [Rhodococcus sp. ACS1]
MSTSSSALGAAPHVSKVRDQSRRAALAGYIGSTLEYYDFFIYASAATLVFDKVFFAGAGDLSLLISLGTLGVSWLVRPLGALVWGHFGDKMSRKQILVLTLLLMGGSTLAIGFIPSYATIGVAAPILLTMMLMLQGLSAAGETAGASSLVVEASGESSRAFNSSWIQTGNLTGFILATLVFIPVAALPERQLLTWGWRLPFLLSIVLIIAAFIIRRRLEEPKVFEEGKVEDSASVRRPPLRELAAHHKGAVLRVGALGLFQGTHVMVTVFGLAYATRLTGASDAMMLSLLLCISVLSLVTVPFGGWLSDWFGRKRVFSSGASGCILAFILYMWSLSSGNTAAIVVAAILVYGISYSIGNGSTMALFAEQFPVRVRYSGLAISMQISGLVYGFAPSIGFWLVGNDPANWPFAIAIEVVLCAGALIACITAKETAFTPIADIGISSAADSEKN